MSEERGPEDKMPMRLLYAVKDESRCRLRIVHPASDWLPPEAV